MLTPTVRIIECTRLTNNEVIKNTVVEISKEKKSIKGREGDTYTIVITERIRQTIA
ncbi:MAG: hypothetical protein Q7S61_05095 [bacterium]|nr:hypothetical protein [bacterium]